MTNIVPNKAIRGKILALQDRMVEMSDGTELDAFPVEHFFAHGTYARQMFLPKGHILIGKIHKYECVNIVSYGRIRVATEEGLKTIEGPCTFVSPAGVKRAGFVEEDTLWTVIHATNETDLEKIEEEVIAPSFEALEEFQNLLENK